MAENPAQERTEDATPRRRLEARKKGTVAKSSDLTGSAGLMALIIVLPTALSIMGAGFTQGLKIAMEDIPKTLDFATLRVHTWNIMQPCLLGLGLMMGTVLCVGLISSFAQVGFVLSPEAMQPKLEKLNPMNGLKRLFSFSATFDGLKAVAKSFLFGLIAWKVISANWGEIISLGYVSPAAAIAATGDILKNIFMKIGIFWLLLAAVDYYFQRKQVDKQLRMSKQELRQEMKEMETSPELKAAQARRRRQLSKGRMMEAVKSADVVITNPTHFAVAVKYEPGKEHAPVVVAKGADFLAAKIREVAEANKVPLVPNPPLARALYKKCEIGDYVPRELFQAVAEVLAYVYKTIKKIKPNKK